jgi:adenylate cyclase
MEPAPEIVLLIERAFQALLSGDAETFIDCLSRTAGTLLIGQDPNEWWVGFEENKAIVRVQLQEWPDIHSDIEEIVAWKEGSVGWVAAKTNRGLVGQPAVPARLSAVLHQEGAYWRIVQWHFSVPVANEEFVGVELTTALEGILTGVQDEEPPSSAMAGDGSVVIMFTDIEGSTALMESLGEDRWLELLQWHNEVIRQQTAVFGGSVVKGQGDGFMLAFAACGAAVACAVALQRALKSGWAGIPVPTRVGIHCGNAKAEAGDFFGRTVVVAARISAAAAGGEILTSQQVQESLAGAFRLGTSRSLTLKGIAGQQTAFPVVWEIAD